MSMRKMWQARRRTLVSAVASVAALVGVSAVSIAALRSPEQDTSQAAEKSDVTSPDGLTTAVADTPSLRCPASSVDLGVSGLFGPSLQEVANNAAGKGEEVLVYPGAEGVRARGVVMGPGGQPRLVFRLVHEEGGWNLDQTSACLRPEPVEAPCGPVVRFDGAEYELVEGEPDGGCGRRRRSGATFRSVRR